MNRIVYDHKVVSRIENELKNHNILLVNHNNFNNRIAVGIGKAKFY